VEIVIENWAIVQPVPFALGEAAIVYLSMTAGSNLVLAGDVSGTEVSSIAMSESEFDGYVKCTGDIHLKFQGCPKNYHLQIKWCSLKFGGPASKGRFFCNSFFPNAKDENNTTHFSKISELITFKPY
jgi:hypothetical protein